ncbi:MAG: MFS transporter [Alphaproteobacteria bacterium]|nr:MFS transporter [Alphaproteobacteria bacterium]MDP6815004.1 MFS transporter [Alphaproteobacteria bacterium]
MSSTGLASALAPFRVRSFRFQWPADLLTSWAFEMETLILGWYVLSETGSVLLLTVFGSLQFLGTLIAPMFGVVADRLGRRAMLLAMRTTYVSLAAVLMALGLSDLLTPYQVLALAFGMGLVRPSDLVMRNALIGDTVPVDWLAKAIGLSRMTMDSARIAGALVGAGLFSFLGIGPAYIVVTAFYLVSLGLTLGVAGLDPGDAEQPAEDATSPWRELTQGLAFVRHTPEVLALMCLAFLVNLTAFPVTFGLLPYVAREIYAIDQIGLGHLVAGFAGGALLGSLAMTLTGGARHPGRLMLLSMIAWYGLVFLFGQQAGKLPGFAVLLAIGVVQSIAMISMSVTLLRITPERYRGRVMGVRMLAVYGLPLGLLAGGVAIDGFGFGATMIAYSLIGVFFVALLGIRWRDVIWR